MILNDSLEFASEFLHLLILRIELAILVDSVRESSVELLKGHIAIAIHIELWEDWLDFIVLQARCNHANQLHEFVQIERTFAALIEVLEDLLQREVIRLDDFFQISDNRRSGIIDVTEIPFIEQWFEFRERNGAVLRLIDEVKHVLRFVERDTRVNRGEQRMEFSLIQSTSAIRVELQEDLFSV